MSIAIVGAGGHVASAAAPANLGTASHLSIPGLHDVRVGSKAALTAPKSNYRFTPESGLKSDIRPCPKSANNGSRRVTRSRASRL